MLRVRGQLQILKACRDNTCCPWMLVCVSTWFDIEHFLGNYNHNKRIILVTSNSYCSSNDGINSRSNHSNSSNSSNDIARLVIPVILVMVVILRIAIMVIGGPDPGSSIQTSRSQRCLHPSDQEMRVAVVRATWARI